MRHLVAKFGRNQMQTVELYKIKESKIMTDGRTDRQTGPILYILDSGSPNLTRSSKLAAASNCPTVRILILTEVSSSQLRMKSALNQAIKWNLNSRTPVVT